MIIKTKSAYPYNNKGQVKNWVAKLLDLDPKKINIQLITSIGWNGSEFISSTDWKVRTDKGVSAFHPSAVPQYNTFVSINSGTNIIFNPNHKNIWWIDYDKKKSVLRMPDGSVRTFDAGQSIEYVWPDDANNILLSDCLVKLEEDDDVRYFTIVADENTTYGEFIDGTFWPI